MPCELVICGLQVRCQCSATLSALVYLFSMCLARSLCIVGCLPVMTHVITGIVIAQATVGLLCCILAFVQVLYHALTKTMRSHHILQITIVD